MVLTIKQSSDMLVKRLSYNWVAEVTKPESESCPEENLVNRLVTSVKARESNVQVYACPQNIDEVRKYYLAATLFCLLMLD